jgi:hypothetical protein
LHETARRRAGRERAADRLIKTTGSSAALRLLPKPAPSDHNDRRIYPRRARTEFETPPAIRIPGLPPIALVNLSSGGLLVETPFQLRPGARANVELVSGVHKVQLPLRLLRCYVSEIQRGLWYRAACEFEEQLRLPALIGEYEAEYEAESTQVQTALQQLQLSFASDDILQEPRFKALLDRIAHISQLNEPRMLIKTRIEHQLRALFPSLVIHQSGVNRPMDPSTTSRFFDLEFHTRVPLSRADRHFLRACAQLLNLFGPRSSSTADPEAIPATYEIVRSASEWIHNG